MSRRFAVASAAALVSLVSVVCCSTTPRFADADGGKGAGGTASGGQCTIADDCPGDENECAHRACTDGVCGMDDAPLGFVVAQQVSGDCKKSVCDGNGKITVVDDDGDVPNDGNACTVGLCKNGVATTQNAPSGTACGATGTLTCDGNGQCTGCNAAADCGADGPCATYQCNGGTCAIQYTPEGTGDPGAQQAGDCHAVVCNGSGATETVVDDTDVPDDANPCTVDSCSMGSAVHASAPAGTSCGGSFQCDGKGSCGGCTMDADCGQSGPCATYACVQGSCQATFVPAGQGSPPGGQPGDCQKVVCDGSGGTKSVADDGDAPTNDNPCVTKSCANGVPTSQDVAAGTSCGALTCDGAGHCTGCASNADCPAATACASYLCQAGSCNPQFVAYGQGNPGADASGNCHRNACDGSGNVTSVVDDSDLPNDGEQCTTDSCQSGNPVYTNKASGTACSENGGSYCNGSGSCVQCVSNGQCSGSNACRTAVCSGNSCGFTYVANGTLTGTQTSGDCKKKVCDGSGNVVQVADNDPPASTQCATYSCSSGSVITTYVVSGTACSENGGSFCNGTGTCVECTADLQCGNAKCSNCIGGSCSYEPPGTLCGASRECDGAGVCEYVGCNLCSQPPRAP